MKELLVRMGVGGEWWVQGTNFHPFHRSRFHILKSLTFVLIVECPDHGETSSAAGPIRPGVAGPSGLNMEQSHPDQGILRIYETLLES